MSVTSDQQFVQWDWLKSCSTVVKESPVFYLMFCHSSQFVKSFSLLVVNSSEIISNQLKDFCFPSP